MRGSRCKLEREREREREIGKKAQAVGGHRILDVYINLLCVGSSNRPKRRLESYEDRNPDQQKGSIYLSSKRVPFT